MTKFAVYYGVNRKDGSLDCLDLSSRNDLNLMKARCKQDLQDDKMAEKYQSLVIASDYGLVNKYKLNVPVKKAPVKKARAKKS